MYERRSAILNSEEISPSLHPLLLFHGKGGQKGPKLQGRIPVKFCHTCQADAYWEGGSVLVTPTNFRLYLLKLPLSPNYKTMKSVVCFCDCFIFAKCIIYSNYPLDQIIRQ